MPAFSAQGSSQAPTRAMAWFGGARALPLLQAEGDAMAALLASRAPHPWLWLAPLAQAQTQDPGVLPVRGLRLHREAALLAGAVRCGLPLPLPSESFGCVVLQHVLDDGRLPGLLEEAVRILQPGGRLWLFALNPMSPYRWQWRGAGLDAVRLPVAWRARLRLAGLQPDRGGTDGLGPVWSPAGTVRGPRHLRAACLLGAEKRASSLTPLRPARPWRTDPAPALVNQPAGRDHALSPSRPPPDSRHSTKETWPAQ